MVDGNETFHAFSFYLCFGDYSKFLLVQHILLLAVYGILIKLAIYKNITFIVSFSFRYRIFLTIPARKETRLTWYPEWFQKMKLGGVHNFNLNPRFLEMQPCRQSSSVSRCTFVNCPINHMMKLKNSIIVFSSFSVSYHANQQSAPQCIAHNFVLKNQVQDFRYKILNSRSSEFRWSFIWKCESTLSCYSPISGNRNANQGITMVLRFRTPNSEPDRQPCPAYVGTAHEYKALQASQSLLLVSFKIDYHLVPLMKIKQI